MERAAALNITRERARLTMNDNVCQETVSIDGFGPDNGRRYRLLHALKALLMIYRASVVAYVLTWAVVTLAKSLCETNPETQYSGPRVACADSFGPSYMDGAVAFRREMSVLCRGRYDS